MGHRVNCGGGAGVWGAVAGRDAWRVAGIVALLSCGVAAPGADDPAAAFEKARQRADAAARAGAIQQAPVRFPPRERLDLAATAEGALALWAQISPVLRERMLRANRRSALMVMAPLDGSDTSVAQGKSEAQRAVALAQIQGACATFLATPGIPLTAEERDLLAAYAARVGEARQAGSRRD